MSLTRWSLKSWETEKVNKKWLTVLVAAAAAALQSVGVPLADTLAALLQELAAVLVLLPPSG